MGSLLFCSFVFIDHCLSFVPIFEGDSYNIRPGTESTVRVIFSPKFEGLFKATLELVFFNTQLLAWIVVRRELQGIAGSLEDHKHFECLGQELTESIREVQPQKVILLCSPDRRRGSRKFPVYEVPPVVHELVEKSTVICPYDENAPSLISAMRPGALNMNTYAHYFKALLNVEDGHQQ